MNVGEVLEDSLNLFAALIISAAKISPYSLTVILVFLMSLDAFRASTAAIPTRLYTTVNMVIV